MTTKRKTPEERLSILLEGEREGQASTIRKYHIAPSLYARVSDYRGSSLECIAYKPKVFSCDSL